MRKKRQNKYLWLLLVLLAVSIGYAALSTTLKINGSALLNKNTWSVYWRNAVVTEGSVSQTPPTIGEDQGDPEDTKVTFEVNLDLPGDFYEFTVEAVNNGTIDAMILDMTPSSTPALPDYIKYTIVYDDDDEPLEQFHALRKAKNGNPTTETYRVRIEYSEDITPAQMNAIPAGGNSYTLTYGVQYAQADDRAIDKVPSQGCPGKKCIYAFYNGLPGETYDDTYPGYSIDIGDTLPLSLATASSHNATEKYFGGPTYNYKELNLGYTEYISTNIFNGVTYHNYYNSLYECNLSSKNCSVFRTTSFHPKTFFGHILDDDGKVIQKFACLDYKDNVYCFDTFKIYGSKRDAGLSAYNVFSIAFGEYDANTGKGCKISNPDSETTFSFVCKGDDEASVEFISGAVDHAGLNILTSEPTLDIAVNLHSTYLSGPTTYIFDD